MSQASPGGPPEEGGGWVILGVLNEVLLRLVSHADLPALWREVCASARWIVRSQRLCVVLAEDGGGATLVARSSADGFEHGGDEGHVVVDAWMAAALQAQRASWHRGPWDSARSVDFARAWLLEADPEVVFHVPIQARGRTLGSMLFALEQQRLIDRKTLASATTYALYVGATYTMLKNSLEIAAAGELLQQKNAELEGSQIELRRQLEIIGTQHEAMLSMSTPIMQVWDGVLTLPVIGAIDRERASRMMEEVLSAVVRYGARFMIVDLTGAEAAEPATVQHLVRIFAATKLLGSECLVSGVPPTMVRRMLEVEVELRGFRVFSTMKSALEHAMKIVAALPR